MNKRPSQYPNLEGEFKDSEREYYVGSLLCHGKIEGGGMFGLQPQSMFKARMNPGGFGAYSHGSFYSPMSYFASDILEGSPSTFLPSPFMSSVGTNPFTNIFKSTTGNNPDQTPETSTSRAADQPVFRKGEELFTKKQCYELNLYKRGAEQSVYISLRNIMLTEMFLQTKSIDDLHLSYFVESEKVEKRDYSEWLPIRIEVAIKESIFNEDYKKQLEQNQVKIVELREKSKKLRKENKTKKDPKIKKEIYNLEEEAGELQAQNNLNIAHRQLIIKLIRMAGMRVNEQAIVKPEFSKDMTTRLILLKERQREIKWNKKNFNFEDAFDAYCLRKCGKVAIVKYIKNERELREYRRSSRRPVNFKRVLCAPEIYIRLSEEEQRETKQFQHLIDKRDRGSSELITDLVINILANEHQELDLNILKEEDPEILEELKKQIQEEENKLDKSIEVKRGRSSGYSEGLTTRIFFERYIAQDPDKTIMVKKRLLNKILSRKKNKELFDEFELETLHLRETPTPDKISTRLLQHQSQALTWMKFREQRISPKVVLSETYKGSNNLEDRVSSVYWEEIQLIDGKRIFLNYFTGEFSNQKTNSKVVHGGILAYDMGLGKTITALSLIYDTIDTIKTKKGTIVGKNLYVTISTVLPNEIEGLVRKHVRPPCNYIIIDRQNRKQLRDLRGYDIVFISYETLKSEYKEFLEVGYTDPEEQTSDAEDLVELIKIQPNLNQQEISIVENPAHKRPLHQKRTTVFGYYWNRIILDEAHHIRNRDTLASEATCALRGYNRWCLTGTPVQNNKTEMYALLKFLKVEIFSEWKWWNRYIEKSESLEDGFATLHKILRKIMLMKAKTAKNLNGDSIIHLPDKTEHLVLVQFSEQESCAYELMRDITENFILKLIEKRNKKDKSEEEKKQNQKDTCSVFTLIMKLRQFCDDPCLAIPNFSSKKTQQSLKKHLERKLLRAAEPGEGAGDEEFCVRCKFEYENLSSLECGHKICVACNTDIDEDGLEPECPQCFRPAFPIDRRFGLMRQESDTSTVFGQSIAASIIRPGRPPRAPQRMLPIEESADEDQQQGEEEPFQEYYSSKLMRVVSLANEIVERGEKLIIFSQWIKMMERISKQLDWYNIKVICLNSKLKIPERRELLQQFTRADIQVLVTSLKTSGEGLNLSVASSVIIVDPDWNPTIEQQGIDRSHRFGQLREVSIYRVAVEKTIQQKMRDLHEKKIQERNYTMMDRRFFQGKKYIERMLSLVSRSQ